MKPSTIKRRLETLESNRRVVEELWTDVERYVCPYRGKFYEPQSSEGEFEWFRPYRMDDTAVQSHNRLAASFQAKMTPSAFKWFAYRFSNKKTQRRKQFAAWLDDVSSMAFEELQNSLFGESMGAFYGDLTSYASAYIGRELPGFKDWDGIDFKTLPLKECYAERDHKGRIIKFYRKMNMSIAQMVDKFGKENIPKSYQDRADSETEDIGMEYPVVFAVWKRKVNVGRTDRAVAPDNRPFGYRYIDYDSLEPFGEEGGYYTMPVYFVRYRMAVGSDFGFGPAAESMSDIKTLNRLVYLHMKQIEIQVNPPTLTTEDNLITDLDLSDGGLTVVENVDGTRPYFSGGRLEVSAAEIERKVKSIERAFHIDQLELKQSPAMTATEVAALTRQSHETLGSPVENLKSQGLKPLLMDTFADMLRFGQLPEVPDGLDLDQEDIEIEYFGSMALAQKADVAAGIERTVGDASGLAEVFPEIMDNFDPDEVAQELGSLNGAPARIFRSEAEIEQIRAERKAQQQEMMEAEKGKMDAEAAQKQADAFSKMAPGQGAGLAEVMGGMAG